LTAVAFNSGLHERSRERRFGSAAWNGSLREGKGRSRPRAALATFQSIAAKAKAGCPVSKLMKVEIGFGATLLS